MDRAADTRRPAGGTYTYEMQRNRCGDPPCADGRVGLRSSCGAGDKFFCAGANIGMLNSVTPTCKYYFCLHANETL